MAANYGKSIIHTSMSPSAPDDNQNGTPPPSYEESLKMNTTIATYPQYSYSYPTPYQQQALQHSQIYAVPGTSHLSYGYDNPYQMHMQQQQTFYNTTSTAPQLSTAKPTENVLRLAKGAKVRTTASGAISIPPPPPGCAPTLGQMAAMAGQPVIVKKPKKSLF